jgi:ankyrin repeat protein
MTWVWTRFARRLGWAGVVGIVMAQTAWAAENPNALRDRDFCVSCWNSDLDQVTALLQQNPPLEMRMGDGRTPLILAAHGNPAIVKLLLAHGAQVNVADQKGDTPFSLAAENGILDSVKMLLAAGASLNTVNQWNRTPLDLAAREGHDDVVAYLLAQHADLTAGDPTSPPLSYAVWKDHLSTATLLLNAGAPVTVADRAKGPGKTWGTLMQNAIYTGDLAVIDLLLDHGGDLNEADSHGNTALFAAITRSHDVAFIRHLLEKGADPNVPDREGWTPFTSSVTYGTPEIVRLLLDHGARLNTQDLRGRTVLMIVAGFNNEKDVRELLENDADVNVADKTGETALTYAGDRGGVEIVRLLKQAGARPQPFHIILKPMHEMLSRPQAWALAVGALYGQYNGYSHDSLPQNPHRKESLTRQLARDWGVRNHDELVAEVDRLNEPSSRERVAGGELSDILLVKKSQGWWAATEETGLLLNLDLTWHGRFNVAWNACRAANMIRNGVTIGYLKESEAWPLLIRNAQRVQRTYGSWREMNDSFLDSREIWAGERDPDFRACSNLLLNPKDPNSPWNRLPWKTDLTAK